MVSPSSNRQSPSDPSEDATRSVAGTAASGGETIRALVLTGFGLNCEAETSHTLRLAGAEPSQVHLSDLVSGEASLDGYDLLAVIGGFSFGDHLGGGKVLANRLKYRLGEQLLEFIERDGLIIGICNGFQVLVKLGILPGLDSDDPETRFTQRVTLTHNDVPGYRDAWIKVAANTGAPCVFTSGMDVIDLPVRHGEGKFYADPDVLNVLRENQQIVLRYVDPDTMEPTDAFPANPNGSIDAVAGICDPTGRIFGLMPHPEAFHSPLNHPHWRRRAMQGALPAEGAGVQFFRNAVRAIQAERGRAG